MDGVRLPRLYGWQVDALEAWQAGDRCGIVEAVTGTGKTMVGLVAIAGAVADGRKALVLVPGKELQTQWKRELRRCLPGRVRIGLRGDGHRDTLRTHDVVVSVVNSARSAGLHPPPGALLVGDECHRYASVENRKALDPGFDSRLGLTATLERPDRLERKVIDYFGSTCFTMGYPQASADEVTAHFRVALVGCSMTPAESYAYDELSKKIADLFRILTEQYGLPTTPFHRFMAEVQQLADGPPSAPRTYAQRFRTAVYERKSLLANSPTKQALAGALEPAVRESDKTLVFTDSIDTAETIADDLFNRGIATETVHSELKTEDRRIVLADFKSGRIKALVAPRVLDEGIDVPAADLAIIVAASKTRRQMIQRMGRVLRRKDDDRIARFAILFLRGTTEDPTGGAHEAFLGEVTPVADKVSIFIAEDNLEEAIRFLQHRTPDQVPATPRYEGEPKRGAVAAVIDDESVDAFSFLGMTPQQHREVIEPDPRAAQVSPTPVITSRGAPNPSERRFTADALTVRRRTLCQAFSDRHPMVSRREMDRLDLLLRGLMRKYSDDALLPALRATSELSQIEWRAEANQSRLSELRAAAELQRSAAASPGHTSAQASTRQQRSPRRNRRANPRPASGAALGERPHSQPPPSPSPSTRMCPSCGFREEACACA